MKSNYRKTGSNQILTALQPFKIPIIILLVLCVSLIVAYGIIPVINASKTEDSPIASIEATVGVTYSAGEQIDLEDFTITAIHENGSTSTLLASDVTINRTGLNPVGGSTTVTISLVSDSSIRCTVDVEVEREIVTSFEVGSPNKSSVVAVLYTNGELCFEGEGDVRVYDEDDFPWLDYDEIDEYPITAVSFEDGVMPTDMNYWFEGVSTLTYVDAIPSSVKTMVRTFANCTSLTDAADWSECTQLLNITEIYSGCTLLDTVYPLVSSIRTAENAFYGCTSLVECPDSSNATNLTNATGMYAQCSSLMVAEVGVAVTDMTEMFAGCINLKEMPEIPNTVTNMTEAFDGDVSLVSLSTIPSSVTNLSYTFRDCQLIQGTVTINCNAESFGNMFRGACLATQVNLVGSSLLLDAYANTSDTGNIFVNGLTPDSSITSYDDVFNEDTIIRTEASDENATEDESEETIEDAEESIESITDETEETTYNAEEYDIVSTESELSSQKTKEIPDDVVKPLFS